MRAIRVAQFGDPGVMGVEEIETPRPAPGQVLVRLHAAGVNPVDTYIRSGQYGIKPELPYTPGFDGAGEVVELAPAGAALPSWPRVGDRVWVGKRGRDGTYADHIVCDLAQVHPLPARLSYAQGAAVYVAYCTAWRAIVHSARARPGEILLVHGASGGVGLAAVQIGRAMGLRVLGTAGTPEGRALVEAQGAEAVFDHRQPGYESAIAAWVKRAATGGPGAPGGLGVIVEMLANVNLQRDIDLLGPRGRIVVVGNRGSIEINPRGLMGKDAAVIGLSLMNVSAAEDAEMHAAIGAGLAGGAYTPVVGRQLPLADAPKAHELIMGSSALGKIVLLP